MNKDSERQRTDLSDRSAWYSSLRTCDEGNGRNSQHLQGYPTTSCDKVTSSVWRHVGSKHPHTAPRYSRQDISRLLSINRSETGTGTGPWCLWLVWLVLLQALADSAVNSDAAPSLPGKSATNPCHVLTVIFHSFSRLSFPLGLGLINVMPWQLVATWSHSGVTVSRGESDVTLPLTMFFFSVLCFGAVCWPSWNKLPGLKA